MITLYIKRVQVTPHFYPRFWAVGLLMCIARLWGGRFTAGRCCMTFRW